MSEVSALSYEYQTASELAQTLNASLIALKRVVLGLPGSRDVPRAEIEESRQRLASIVRAVLAWLENNGQTDAASNEHVPGSVVARLRMDHRGDLPYFVEDLKRVGTLLGPRGQTPTADDLRLLDELAAAADAETTRVFRQLMRR